MRSIWFLIPLALVACTHRRPPVLSVPTPPPLRPVQVMALPSAPEVPTRPFRDDSVHVIERANVRALIRPTAEDFINAEVVFPYRHGALYLIDTCIHEPTALILPPGEHLRKYVSGDQRWIKDVSEGVDPVHVFIMPSRAGLRTRITLVTDKARYQLLVRSGTKTSLAAVTWRHPPTRREPLQGLYGVGYGISQTDLLWAPLYAWDYGGQTFLLFDSRVPQMTSPSVTVVHGEQTSYVNYGPVLGGQVYVVDHLLGAGERFELRLSAQPEQTVHLARVPETRMIHCPGSEACGVVQHWTRMRDASR